MQGKFETNWLGGAIGGLLGGIGNAQKMSYINDMYENMWAAAISQYKATEDAVNIMKTAAEAQLRDTIGELERVGASYQRDVEQEGKKAMGSLRASREGLTGGNSAVRQEIATQIKINEVAADTQEKTQSMINQMVDKKDTTMNNLNNQLMQAYNQMQGALARQAPTESFGYRFGNMLTNVIKGFGAGWQIESRIKDAMRPQAELGSYALSDAYKTVRPEYASKKPFIPFLIQ